MPPRSRPPTMLPWWTAKIAFSSVAAWDGVLRAPVTSTSVCRTDAHDHQFRSRWSQLLLSRTRRCSFCRLRVKSRCRQQSQWPDSCGHVGGRVANLERLVRLHFRP